MKLLVFLVWIISLCCIISDGYAVASIASKTSMISIPVEAVIPKLKNGGRISDYTVSIYDGSIYSVSKIINDWRVEVKNDQIPQLKSFAVVGAANLSADDVLNGAFIEFLLIQTPLEEDDFKIKFQFTVYYPSKDKDEQFTLDPKDIIITPLR